MAVPREQAEAHVQMMTDIIETNLATKQDLKDLRGEIKDLSVELRGEIVKLSAEIEKREHRMVIPSRLDFIFAMNEELLVARRG